MVVVSALSGVTDRLLGVAAEAGAGDAEGARTNLRDLRDRHHLVARVIAGDGMRWEAAELIASLGLVARAEGKLAEARQLFDQALAFWREIGNPHGVAVVTACVLLELECIVYMGM